MEIRGSADAGSRAERLAAIRAAYACTCDARERYEDLPKSAKRMVSGHYHGCPATTMAATQVEFLLSEVAQLEAERDAIVADLVRQVEAQRRESVRLERLLDSTGIPADGGGTIGALTDYERVQGLAARVRILEAERDATREAGNRIQAALSVIFATADDDLDPTAEERAYDELKAARIQLRSVLAGWGPE